MKNPFLKAFVLMLSLSLLSTTCEDEIDDITENVENANELQDIIESGTWRITSLFDSGENLTNDFTGFSFNFESNGNITATSDTETESGTYIIDFDDDLDDNDIDLVIEFPVSDNNDFNELNEDWDVVSFTSTTIMLEDIDGNFTDTLVFEKN